ncbi:MAG: PqiC family protein [Ideonella sp.]
MTASKSEHSASPAALQRLPRVAMRLAQLAPFHVGRLMAGLATAVLLACSTTPPPLRLHSLLDSETGFAATGNGSAAGAPARLVITPIQVPTALDRPQWLVRRADESLQLLEEDRWASPLADELKAALRARLSSRWNVVDGALPTSGTAADSGFSWRLVLEVLRLDARPAVDVQLEARWTLLAPQVRSLEGACSVRIVEPVQGQGPLPIADAYRRATLRLADRIGAQLRAGEQSGAQSCGMAAVS